VVCGVYTGPTERMSGVSGVSRVHAGSARAALLGRLDEADELVAVDGRGIYSSPIRWLHKDFEQQGGESRNRIMAGRLGGRAMSKQPMAPCVEFARENPAGASSTGRGRAEGRVLGG